MATQNSPTLQRGFSTIAELLVRKLIDGNIINNIFTESDCCERQYCGPARGFVMHITDNLNQVSSFQFFSFFPVLHFSNSEFI